MLVGSAGLGCLSTVMADAELEALVETFAGVLRSVKEDDGR